MKGKRASFIVIGILWTAFGCANIYTARGLYHRIQPGETLYSLAGQYDVPVQDLAELNNIEDPNSLKAGRSVFIPRARPGKISFRPRSHRWARREPSTAGKKVTAMSLMPRVEADHKRFSWPVEGEISSLYGVRRGRRHDGLDIRAPRGAPIYAAAKGEVVYSKRLRGYGNLILLKHPGDFFTVYAHNSVNLVKRGAQIQRGQVIAKVGSTGRSTGPHVHFEVRVGSKPRNPLFFLPENRLAKKALQKESGEALGGE